MGDPLTQQHNQNQLFLETHTKAWALLLLLLLSLHYCSSTSTIGDMTSKPTFFFHINLIVMPHFPKNHPTKQHSSSYAQLSTFIVQNIKTITLDISLQPKNLSSLM
jgi:hypothetical protein